ncbi:MAG: N-acetyl-gamma-glutamyl-phosphate reductase [Anaerovoracaceae bacterium]|jgi:N-acetyl-gamma-glutamyl-phosphate reductase
MKYKVFVDGGSGTTGLKIHERLNKRDDIEIINIQEEKRKDLDEKIKKMKEADITFLCLPDAAAMETAAAAPADCKILDTSTAHRTDPEWVYGMPELQPGQREKIRNSNRVAVPGCHASGFIFIVKPLVAGGIIDVDYPLDATSMTGYSGGGKKMIAAHEAEGRPAYLGSTGQYALGQQHKHLPEMMAMTGIREAPCFLPIVGDYYSGMVVTVPLHRIAMKKQLTPAELLDVYRDYYAGEAMVKVNDSCPEDGFIHSDIKAGYNDIEIFVYGNEDRPVISSRFDNLGKGASGAAIQNMNIMLGIEETRSLEGDK